MNHWPFIYAAYGVTLVGTLIVSISSWRAARNAEARADAMKQDR
jgi:hypothetical protein